MEVVLEDFGSWEAVSWQGFEKETHSYYRAVLQVSLHEDSGLRTADLPLSEPFIDGGAVEASELSGQFDVRQTAGHEGIDRAEADAQARCQFSFGLVVFGVRMARAVGGLSA